MFPQILKGKGENEEQITNSKDLVGEMGWNIFLHGIIL